MDIGEKQLFFLALANHQQKTMFFFKSQGNNYFTFKPLIQTVA